MAAPANEIDVFDPELMKDRNLSSEQQDRIQQLEAEINDIWSKKGDYEVDDEAWKTMPLFMENIQEDDLEKNPDVAALSNIKYEERDPKERVVNFKTEGNKMLVMALNPEQINPKNLARSAVRFYNNAIAVKCDDKQLTAQIYGNRSMAHYLLNNFGHGLEDAQKAIVLQKDYTKAYYRGAKCAERIRKFETARQLIEYGLQTNPNETAVAEFQAVLKAVEEGEAAASKKTKIERTQARAAAADSSAIVRKMQTAGIDVGRKLEVSSEQWAQLRTNKPYFDETSVLHVPVMVLWDEFSQSDFAQDVACDVPLGDLIDSMLPPPWDEKGQYQMVEGLVVYFKIDDGVKMPEYYQVDPDWQLMEIFRTAKYTMPGLVPTFHVVAQKSPFLDTITLQKIFSS